MLGFALVFTSSYAVTARLERKTADAISADVLETQACEEPETIPVKILTFTPEEASSCIEKIARAKASYAAEHNVLPNKSNAFLLAAAICCEAGGEKVDVMMLVGTVIMNRVSSPYFPNTIYGVLTQKHQYGMFWKYGVDFPAGATQSMKDTCYAVAERLLAGERACPSNVVFQAEFPQGSGTYIYTRGIYFCYL